MKIFEIINQVRNTAGSKAKKEILNFQMNEVLEQIFADTYDKSRNYYVKKYNREYETMFSEGLTIDANYDVFHNMLNQLNDRTVTGDAAVALVEDTIAQYVHNEREILHLIMDRNLKIGVGMDSFNKVGGANIDKFEVALAYNLDKVKNVNPIDGTYYASRKLDGVRCIAIVDNEAQTVQFFSRQGKEFTSIDHIKPTLLNMCDDYLGKFVFDGELCVVDEDGNEDFSKAVQRVTKKGVTANDVRYCIFDFIPYGRIPQRTLYDFVQLHLVGDAVGTGAVGNIIVDAHGEGIGFLEHHANLLAQLVHIHFLGENVGALISNVTGDLHAGDQVVHAVEGFQESRLTAAGRADKCGNALFGDFNIHIFQCLMVAVPQAHIFYRDNTHKLLLFAKCFCTKVAAKLISTAKTIRMAAMAKATPNSPCSFA